MACCCPSSAAFKLVLLHPWLLWKEESQVVCSSTKEEGPWL